MKAATWHGHITQAIDGSAWHNHDTRIPWDEICVDNVPVLTPPGCRPSCGRWRPTWTKSVMLLAEHARHQLHPAT